MKTINIGIISFAGALIALASLSTSCEKQLGALPGQSKVYENLVNSQQTAEVALNGAYAAHAFAGQDYDEVDCAGNAGFTEIYPAYFAGIIESENYYGDMFVRGASASSDALSMWMACYQQFNATNFVIAAVEATADDKFSGNRKKEILAEARLLRAMGHINVLKYFGYSWDYNSPYGIILRTEPTSVRTSNKARSSVKETYEFILDDIDFAIKYAPETNSNCYVNKWVAKGLKSRVLLMRGQGTDYADAAALCDDIIKNGPYELEGNLVDIYRTKGLDSKEVMFGIQPKANQSMTITSIYMYGFDLYTIKSSVFNLFASTDTRVGTMVSEQSDKYGSYLVQNRHYAPGQEEGSPTTVGETLVEMRLSEIYLMRAEALLRVGSELNVAKSLIKEVETHAGVTDFTAFDALSTKDALMAELFNENIRNFFCEAGIEAGVMLRFPNNLVSAISDRFPKPAYYVLPIPEEEFEYNSALDKSKDQNPEY